MKEKKQMKAPHVFVLVLIMIVCATLLTYVLPAGSYNRYVDESTGTTLVESGSYQRIEQTPVSLFAMLESIPKGLVDAASVVTHRADVRRCLWHYQQHESHRVRHRQLD